MNFKDKDKDKKEILPFQVEIRKKNPSQNININQQNYKHKQQQYKQKQQEQQQESKNQEIQSSLNSLKKTLEVNQTKNYVNPLIGVFQKNLEEAEKKKQEELLKEEINKRLYAEYQKRQEQRKQMVKNFSYNNQNNNTDNRRSVIAPRFNAQNQRTYNNGFHGYSQNQNNSHQGQNNSQRPNNNQNINYRYGNSQQTRPIFNNTNGIVRQYVTKKPPFQMGQTNRPGFVGRNFNNSIFNSTIIKQQLNSLNTPNRTTVPAKKKVIDNKDKKNNKTLALKEKYDNFDWRNYVDNDENQSSNKKILKKNSKNIQIKNKNKQQFTSSIVIETSVNLTDLSKLTSIQIDNLIFSAKTLGVKLSNLQETLDNSLVCLILEMHNIKCSFYGVEEEFKEFLKVDPETCKDSRPPVVCVLGHVDHGKTSLLDVIKKTKIVEVEAGGITQNISLYQLEEYGNTIFIDTPGHSVFSTMRKVGIQVTDIVIVIIAADDGIQDQTREIIEFLKHYNKKIIICITKMDKMHKDFSPTMIYTELSNKYEIIPEEYGGDVPVVKVSNKTGEGVKELLEIIDYTSKNMPNSLNCNNSRSAIGIVVNSYLETGFGIVTYILLKHGTLKIGDEFISGKTKGKVRFIFTPKNAKKTVKQSNSSDIIKVVGFIDIPAAGDDFIVVPNENLKNKIFNLRNKIIENNETSGINNNQISLNLNELTKKKISILLKADNGASLESLSNALKTLSNKQTNITIFSSNIGAVNIMDITKAKEFDLIIVAFNVKVEKEKPTDIKIINHNIIYNILDEVIDLTKRKEIIIKEEECGKGEIIEIFTFDKVVIGGCKVMNGSIFHSDNYICEIFRNNKSIFKGKIDSMKRTNNKIKEAKNGTEVGIVFDNFTDIKLKDEVKCYKVTEEVIILQD